METGGQAVGAAVERAGGAVQGVADEAMDLATRIQQEDDRARLIDAETQLEEAEAGFWNWAKTHHDPVSSDWAGEYEQRMQSAEDAVRSIEGSAAFGRNLTEVIKAKRSAGSIRVESRAVDAVLARSRAAILDRYGEQRRTGNFAGGRATLQKAKASNAFDPIEIDRMEADLNEREGYWDYYFTAPEEMHEIRGKIEELQERSGDGWAHAQNLAESDRMRLISHLKREEASAQSDEMREISRMVDAGEVLTSKELEKQLFQTKTLTGEQIEDYLKHWETRKPMTGKELTAWRDRIDKHSESWRKVPDEQYEEERAQILRDLAVHRYRPGSETLRAQAGQLTLPAQQRQLEAAAHAEGRQKDEWYKQNVELKMRYGRAFFDEWMKGDGEFVESTAMLKELFNDQFRAWLEEHPTASADEAYQSAAQIMARQQALENAGFGVLPPKDTPKR